MPVLRGVQLSGAGYGSSGAVAAQIGAQGALRKAWRGNTPETLYSHVSGLGSLGAAGYGSAAAEVASEMGLRHRGRGIGRALTHMGGFGYIGAAAGSVEAQTVNAAPAPTAGTVPAPSSSGGFTNAVVNLASQAATTFLSIEQAKAQARGGGQPQTVIYQQQASPFSNPLVLGGLAVAGVAAFLLLRK